MPEAATPNPVGRPTKYNPKFCKRVIELMSEGLSIGAVAGELSVARSTVELWQHEHPAFAEAIKIGKAKAQAFWERELLSGAKRGGGPGRATLIIFGLKNRAPDDWRDLVRPEGDGDRKLSDELEADRPVLAPDEDIPDSPVL